MDLRERRRIDTTRLIHLAALALAECQDPEAVTVEAICERAGVSRRTFFNYFPVREAAFISGPPPFSQTALDRFLGSGGRLLDDVIELLSSRLPESEADKRALRLMKELMSRQARIAAMQISAFHEHEKELADLIARRLGAAENDLACRTFSAAALAATRVVLEEWATDPKAQHRPDLRAGFEYLRHLDLFVP